MGEFPSKFDGFRSRGEPTSLAIRMQDARNTRHIGSKAHRHGATNLLNDWRANADEEERAISPWGLHLGELRQSRAEAVFHLRF